MMLSSVAVYGVVTVRARMSDLGRSCTAAVSKAELSTPPDKARAKRLGSLPWRRWSRGCIRLGGELFALLLFFVDGCCRGGVKSLPLCLWGWGASITALKINLAVGL